MLQEIKTETVKAKFLSYSKEEQIKLLELRRILFHIAHLINSNEPLIESLKWGQPSYAMKGGTPIRLDSFGEKQVALFVHCQTHLIDHFRTIFGDELVFSGNRAIVFDVNAPLPEAAIQLCAEAAFTYHKKR
jgi:hypothetical protein